MLALEIIAERRIEEAIARGEFDDLPGAGRPLELDDVDPLLPEELRMAWRILRNSGYAAGGEVPPEKSERSRALRKLALLGARLDAVYYAKAMQRFSR